MDNAQLLNDLTKTLAAEIAQGVLPATIERRLLNAGIPADMANKIARIAELEASI